MSSALRRALLTFATLAVVAACTLGAGALASPGSVGVSGVMVSGSVLLTLGLFVPSGYFFWNPLHALFAKVLLALLLVHIMAHGGWIAGQIAGFRKGEVPSDAKR